MKKRKVSRRKKDDLNALLPEVRTLMDQAIAFRKQGDYDEAIRILTVTVLEQAKAIDNLRPKLEKLRKKV